MEENRFTLSKKYKVLLIIIIFVAIITVILCCTIFRKNNRFNNSNGSNISSGVNTSVGTNDYNYNGSNNNSNNTNTSKYSPAELEKNIVCNGAITEEGNLVAFVKNNNDIPIKMEVEVEFYDSDGMIVGSSSNILSVVSANSEIATEFWSTPDLFDSYKIYVDAEIVVYYKSYIDSIELIHNNTGKGIIVQVKNNSSDVIDDVRVAVVYYNGDKVVGYDNGSGYEIKSDRSANITLSYPHDRNYKNVYFDSYKVFVNEVYSSNY